MYVFTLSYKLEGVAFYANKLPRKRTTHSDLQECRVISPVNLDYNFQVRQLVKQTKGNVEVGPYIGWLPDLILDLPSFSLFGSTLLGRLL